MMPNNPQTFAVIGDGGWGTTLAIHLAKNGHTVYLWGPFAPYVRQMSKNRYNSKFLPGVRIPVAVTVTEQLGLALNADIIVFAVPSKYAVSVLKLMKKQKVDFKKKIILSVTKGIETKTLKRISQVIVQELGSVPIAVLSGPNIASEVAKEVPSTAVIACADKSIAGQLQEAFNSKYFRIYTNTDVAGVELGGSLKNIIAIACGVCDGLGYGSNTKSAIVTRGLAEMSRFGKLHGGDPATFAGLSGLGDLVTTCFSEKSRNRTVGEQLGQGKGIKEITSQVATVAEGVETAKAVYQLSQKHKISMPITEEVYNIIYNRKKPIQAVSDLMSRKIKPE